MAQYQPSLLGPNVVRPGYPDDIVVTFSDTPQTTSTAAIGLPAIPAKFTITTAEEGPGEAGVPLRFRFRDLDGDRTLGTAGEYIEILTATDDAPTVLRPTWRFTVENTGTPARQGDVYRLSLDRPYAPGDVITFSATAARIDESLAQNVFETNEPYVVPNPYVAAASFEPERFGTSGRGDRRLEFRAIPAGASVRIYTVRGQLVKTLTQDGSTAGIVAWDLRTEDNLEIAGGLYIYQVDAGPLGQFVGKFAVIK